MIAIKNYVEGRWIRQNGNGERLSDAATGEIVAELPGENLDYHALLEYGRNVGGPSLRQLTIHERAYKLKVLARYLDERKNEFYELSYHTGATKADSWIDIDGGIGTLFVTSGKARREMQDEPFFVDGPQEALSRKGTFIGQHIYVPMEGAAVHINAFNFPVWGMLEKLGATLIAGMPAIIKPSPVGSYLAFAVFEAIIESGVFPEGSMQFIAVDQPGDLLDHLNSQDVIAFTGSSEIGEKIRSNQNVIRRNVRVNLETDSLNCSILGPDVSPDMEEFDLFIREVTNEMTSKAGQKCTAIRRVLVPAHLTEPVTEALKERLSKATIGPPDSEETLIGVLASSGQLDRLRTHIHELETESERLLGDPDHSPIQGAFCEPVLLMCKHPMDAKAPHNIEAFGPVSTIMPYSDIDEAIKLAKRGGGSLVGSIFTANDDIAKAIALGMASFHGRILIINKDCAKESTGHGSPMPHLTHGGPGRAGGGEELGGIRGILHYMQRVALQGSPTTLSHICNTYFHGGKTVEPPKHPFRLYFEELKPGFSNLTPRRTVTEADIVNFGNVSGDHFYAHFDEIAARDSLFRERVAHGYFVLSAAAGLFVDPAPGPVLANYGIDRLRFVEPVKIGDTIRARITVKRKIMKPKRPDEDYATGVVIWDVEVTNQRDELVAMYDILTLVKRKEGNV